MQKFLTVDDYKDVGVEVILERAGKVYTLYLDPRIKITIVIDGQAKKVKVSKLPKIVNANTMYANFKIRSASEPLIKSSLFFFAKRTSYPLVNYDEFLAKYVNPVVFTEDEIKEIMRKYNFVAAYIKWDGLCLATQELGVDLYLPAFLIDVTGGGVINEDQVEPLPTLEIA